MKNPMRILVLAEQPGIMAERITERYPSAIIAMCDSFAKLPEVVGIDPHVAYTERFEAGPFPRAALFAQPSLRFVHASGAGIDHLVPWDPARVRVCNAGGVQDEGMAQFAVARLIAVAGNFFVYHDQQKKRLWQLHDSLRSPGGVLTVVGLGRIGRACARVAGALGMTVHGVRARPAPCPGVERVVAPGEMHDVLGVSDYAIIVTPLTDRTRGLVDAAAFAAMKPGIILHNMSRGGVVVEDDLVAALRTGRVRAASLDVFETEPLPSRSHLWTMDNVHVTPHVGGMMTFRDYLDGANRVFLDNLDRHVRGEPLTNVVDPALGY